MHILAYADINTARRITDRKKMINSDIYSLFVHNHVIIRIHIFSSGDLCKKIFILFIADEDRHDIGGADNAGRGNTGAGLFHRII